MVSRQQALIESPVAENIGAVRELSKVTDDLGQRIEELESHTVRMTKLKRYSTLSTVPSFYATYHRKQSDNNT